MAAKSDASAPSPLQWERTRRAVWVSMVVTLPCSLHVKNPPFGHCDLVLLGKKQLRIA